MTDIAGLNVDCSYPNCGARAVRLVAGKLLCAVHADEYENLDRPTPMDSLDSRLVEIAQRIDAVEIIARHILARAATDEGVVAWEDYPDLSEDNFERVIEAVKKLAPFPDPDDYRRAYKLLSAEDDK